MPVAILSIGSELSRGELENTNAAWLAERLTSIGFEVREIVAVPDQEAWIEEALTRLARCCELIVSTGGLGPTTDDITTACVARVLGVTLVRDASSFASIQARLAASGRPAAACNAKQADFPRGAVVLPNDHGTAPGFQVTLGECRAFFMPGVPAEMKAMFDARIAPIVEDLVQERHHQVHLHTFGLPESAVNEALDGIESAENVLIAYRARMPEIEVKVLARAPSAAEAEERALRGARRVRERLGDEVVFGEGRTSLPRVVGEALDAKGWRLAVAESCTGGLVGSLITDVPGASRYFAGSAVVYANSAKQRLLGVSAELLEQYGAVSEQVARAMADGALSLYGSDIALALTGIAGPEGGTPEKPVGLVHLAVALASGVVSHRVVYPSSRERIRWVAAYAGLALVRRVLRYGLDSAEPT